MRIQFTQYNHYHLEFGSKTKAERALSELERNGICAEITLEQSRHTLKFQMVANRETRMTVLDILGDF